MSRIENAVDNVPGDIRVETEGGKAGEADAPHEKDEQITDVEK